MKCLIRLSYAESDTSSQKLKVSQIDFIHRQSLNEFRIRT